jgi:hypothetical protein
LQLATYSLKVQNLQVTINKSKTAARMPFMDKEEVKLSLCLINEAPGDEDVTGSEVIAPSFLTSALDEGEWSASRPGRFIPRERAPDILYVERYVGPRAVWTLWSKEKSFDLVGN